MVRRMAARPKGSLMATFSESLGKATLKHLDYVGGLSTQLWAVVRALVAALPITGNRYRWKASVRQMLQIGVEALPMVGLMAVCAGFILAMQGAADVGPEWTSRSHFPVSGQKLTSLAALKKPNLAGTRVTGTSWKAYYNRLLLFHSA